MAERVVKVTLAAQVSSYLQGMEQARKATEKAKGGAEDAAAAYEKQNQAMTEVGAGVAVAGAVAMAATAIAVKAAIDWESAWTGVLKTVNGTPAELARVEDGLRGLTGVLPATHEEIAAVAEAAGQLGIQTGNVVAFTRTMIDLGETTNLSANDAATALARFTNIMGTSQDQVSNLGSAIVGLGNNYATTESEILEMSMRLAGAGKQIGLSEGEVLGLATALSSVGIEAEAGGSAMSKVMIDIAASVEEGGERLEQFASISGMSAKDFADQWRSDPGQALSAFVKGLANAESQGQSTLGVLAELGITEVRMRDALLRSSSAADMFAGAMRKGNQEFEANNALTEEAAKRYATVESRLAIMSNRVRDAAIDFGQVFLPVVGLVAEAIGGIADGFGALPAPIQGVIAAAVALAGVVGVAGGAFLIAMPKIAAFQAALAVLSTSQIPAVAASVGLATASVSRMTAGLTAAARFLTGPWGVALVAAAAGVQVLQAAVENMRGTSEELRNSLMTAKTAADLLGDTKVVTASWMGVEIKSLVSDTDELRRVLQIAETEASGFFGWLGANTTFDPANRAFGEFREGWQRLGVEMQKAPETIGPVFSKMRSEFKLTDAEMTRLINLSPELKAALTDMASAEGVSATEQNLLNLALRQAEEPAKSAADAYRDAAGESKDLTDQVLSLIDAVNTANRTGQDAVTSNARYQESLANISTEVQRQRDEYEKANGTLEGFNLSLDENTASGSANAAQLAGVAGAARDAAEAQLVVDQATMSGKDATDKYAATLAAQRQAFIDSAIQAGYNADEVQNLADRVFALPSAKEIAILAQTADAKNNIEEVIRTYNGREIRLKLTTNQVVVDGKVYGGLRDGRANGGIIPGTPSDRDNRIYAVATGEFITNARATSVPENRAVLEHINSGGRLRDFQGYADGGYVKGMGRGDYRQPVYGGGSTAVIAQQAPARVSIEGMRLTGRLDLGNGIEGFVDGRIVQALDADELKWSSGGKSL